MISSDYPIQALLNWVRFLAGLAMVCGVPGYLAFGRFLPGKSWLTKIVMSIGWGLIFVTIFSLTATLLGPYVYIWIFLPVAWGFSWAVGRNHKYVTALSVVLFDDGWESHKADWWVGGACLVMTVLVLADNAYQSVPLGDGANHAMLTLRVAKAHSLSQGALFAAPFGNPGFAYFPGWHATAALIGQLTGLKPWLCTWYLPVTLLFMLPASMYPLWRTCGVGLWPSICGAWLISANLYFPIGVLGWGGFGHLVGWFVVPLLVMLLCLVANSTFIGLALWTGMSLVALLFIHAAEIAAIIPMGIISIIATRRNFPAIAPGQIFHPKNSLREKWNWRGLLVVCVVFGLGALIILKIVGGGYGVTKPLPPEGTLKAFGKALDSCTRSAGRTFPLQILVVAGLVMGWRRRATRWLSFLACATMVLFVTLETFCDPVSLKLTQIFYQESSRVKYLQMFFLPPLMGGVLVSLAQTRAIAMRLALRRTAIVVIGALVFLPGWWSCYVNQLSQTRLGELDAAGVEFASRLAKEIPQGSGCIANLRKDGSQWAMQISGRPFLQPSNWDMRTPGESDRQTSVLDLTLDPWPQQTRDLRATGCEYVYVADLPEDRSQYLENHPFTRDFFNADPRFSVILIGKHASVYRIKWGEKEE